MMIAHTFFLLASFLPQAAPPQAPTPPPITVEKVADDLYVVLGGGAGNTTIYVTDEGRVLVDPKFERNNAELVARVSAISPRPIRYVFNTHAHGDHSGGNLKLAPAVIVGHSNQRQIMLKRNLPGPPQVTYGTVQPRELRQLCDGRVQSPFRRANRDHGNAGWIAEPRLSVARGAIRVPGLLLSGLFVRTESGSTTARCGVRRSGLLSFRRVLGSIPRYATTTLTDPNFGSIAQTAAGPRIMQLALKYTRACLFSTVGGMMVLSPG